MRVIRLRVIARVLARAGLVTSLVACRAAPAAAQQMVAWTPPPVAGPSFLPYSGFYFQFATLETPDPRFSWEGRVGFDVDLFGYRQGRVSLTGDYDAVLGSERRVFDLNSGTYRFDVAASWRVATVDHRIARQCSQFSQRMADGARTISKIRPSQTAANTAEATCREGQALPPVSTSLMTAA